MKKRSEFSPNEEKCLQAVSTFLEHNPAVTVDEWEADETAPGVAVMQVDGKTVRIRYDKENDNYIVVDSVPGKGPKAVAPVKPQYRNWSDLESRPGGGTPAMLNAIGVITLIGSFLAFLPTFNLVVLIGGIIACTMFAAAASIVKELRLTRAQNEYLIRYIEYRDDLREWKKANEQQDV